MSADIGLIGLAVMGENLVLNMERNGFTVAVFNRTTSKVDEFVNGRGKGKKVCDPRSPVLVVSNCC
jgi:6-phosphogluconate dehydrogenase